ncbi:MAG: exonuclease SbcCD subunit [Belnapia sp.]|nr:exonuclease SbcCD subunit [Belnapia sp.]
MVRRMRFLHTADWHLGRSLGGHSLHEDQERLLAEEFLGMVRDTKPDAVLIAGDVFDRFVPPPEAVELLDDILHRIIRQHGVPVVLIPGNHDHARRLSFGARLLRDAGLHIAQSATGAAVRVGGATVVATGYASPALLATLPGYEGVTDHDTGFAALAPALLGLCTEPGPRLLVAHAFVTGGAESPDSERSLSVGGTGQVLASRFAGFDYVALGHLHRPQTLGAALGGGCIRYSGSLFPYSVEEADHAKSVTLVEFDLAGMARIEELPLVPRRRLRVVRGSFAELRAALTEGRPEGRMDYVALELTDPRPVPEAQRLLSEVFPRIVGLRYLAEAAAPGRLAVPGSAARATRPIDLFAGFYRAMREDAPLAGAAREVVVAAIDAAAAEDA